MTKKFKIRHIAMTDDSMWEKLDGFTLTNKGKSIVFDFAVLDHMEREFKKEGEAYRHTNDGLPSEERVKELSRYAVNIAGYLYDNNPLLSDIIILCRIYSDQIHAGLHEPWTSIDTIDMNYFVDTMEYINWVGRNPEPLLIWWKYEELIRKHTAHETVPLSFEFYPQNMYGTVLPQYSGVLKTETLFIDVGAINYTLGATILDPRALEPYIRKIIKYFMGQNQEIKNVKVIMGYIDISTASFCKSKGWIERTSVNDVIKNENITIDDLNIYLRDTNNIGTYDVHILSNYKNILQEV